MTQLQSSPLLSLPPRLFRRLGTYSLSRFSPHTHTRIHILSLLGISTSALCACLPARLVRCCHGLVLSAATAAAAFPLPPPPAAGPCGEPSPPHTHMQTQAAFSLAPSFPSLRPWKDRARGKPAAAFERCPSSPLPLSLTRTRAGRTDPPLLALWLCYSKSASHRCPSQSTLQPKRSKAEAHHQPTVSLSLPPLLPLPILLTLFPRATACTANRAASSRAAHARAGPAGGRVAAVAAAGLSPLERAPPLPPLRHAKGAACLPRAAPRSATAVF